MINIIDITALSDFTFIIVTDLRAEIFIKRTRMFMTCYIFLKKYNHGTLEVE